MGALSDKGTRGGVGGCIAPVLRVVVEGCAPLGGHCCHTDRDIRRSGACSRLWVRAYKSSHPAVLPEIIP